MALPQFNIPPKTAENGNGNESGGFTIKKLRNAGCDLIICYMVLKIHQEMVIYIGTIWIYRYLPSGNV